MPCAATPDPNMRQHISGQYDAELDAIRDHVMEMGGMVEAQLREATEGLLQFDDGLAEAAIARDREVNRLEKVIDDECNHIVARRQPAASDLRLVMSITKTITDLERIGDEASRIAKMTLRNAGLGRGQEAGSELKSMSAGVRQMLRSSLDAFARVDVDGALEVIARDKEIDRQENAILDRLVPEMEANPDQVRRLLNLIWCARSLERIGDHAKNLCEYVVYLAHGQDVRHLPLDRKREEAAED
jgi:phosphate transport system protein